MSETVHIHALAFGGLGVGRLASGKIVLVRGSAAGDTVRLRIDADKPRHAFGTIETILEPSPERVDPRCERAHRCGGCSWQHLSLEAQRAWKTRLVAEELRRAGLAAHVPGTLGDLGFGFRCRARLHLRSGLFGTMEQGSHTVVPYTGCPILTPELDAFASDVRESLGAFPDADVELHVDSLGQRGMLVELVERTDAHAWDRMCTDLGVYSYRIRRPGSPPGPEGRLLFEDSASIPLAFEPGVFVQTNRRVNSLLVHEVLDACEGGARFCEIYAGAGNFTVHLAGRFQDGTAAESDPVAARMLRRNLRGTGVEVHERADRDEAARLASRPAAELLLADPPRSGMKPLWPVFAASPPGRVVMISCHPMAAIRDVRRLVESAGYTIEKVVPVDMFPQSHHLELVAVLAR
jgi:23S rRNA (uracil1939-C5)-methyltransferase